MRPSEVVACEHYEPVYAGVGGGGGAGRAFAFPCDWCDFSDSNVDDGNGSSVAGIGAGVTRFVFMNLCWW